MGRPSANKCTAIVEHGAFSVRVSRVGVGPLVSIWVHETGNGGRGIVLDFDQAVQLIDGINLVLDEIEVDSKSGASTST